MGPDACFGSLDYLELITARVSRVARLQRDRGFEGKWLMENATRRRSFNPLLGKAQGECEENWRKKESPWMADLLTPVVKWPESRRSGQRAWKYFSAPKEGTPRKHRAASRGPIKFRG